MNGSEKQIAWANDILAPVIQRIATLPCEQQERHMSSVSRIESARKVINNRCSISDWCDKFDQWRQTGVWSSPLLGITLTDVPLVRSVIV